MTREPADHPEPPSDQATPEATPAAPTTATPPPRFYALSTYYLADIHEATRRAVYDEVSEAVLKHQLMGMHHKGNEVRLVQAGGVLSKPLTEILLKNTPDLRERLDRLMMVAISKQIMKTGAKGVDLETLMELGDLLDFEKMVLERRRQQKTQTRSKPARNREPKG